MSSTLPLIYKHLSIDNIIYDTSHTLIWYLQLIQALTRPFTTSQHYTAVSIWKTVTLHNKNSFELLQILYIFIYCIKPAATNLNYYNYLNITPDFYINLIIFLTE